MTFADTVDGKDFLLCHSWLIRYLHKNVEPIQAIKVQNGIVDIFPLDTLDLLEKERGIPVEVSRSSTWIGMPLKEHVKQHGMRNSNILAIAPTATIANIAGCYPCIEPMYKNIYVKSNIAGEFTIINTLFN